MADVAVREVTEHDRVVNHRLQWLLTAYSVRNAERIANDLSIDWHFAYDLRQKCQDEALCMRVMYGSD